MKKAILLIIGMLPLMGFCQKNQALIVADNITQLKNKPVDSTATYLLKNVSTIMDGSGGGLYVWSYGATDAEDLVYYNVVASNLSTKGRYIRTAVKNNVVPNGVLMNNGGMKTLILNATTPANGIVTYYLTSDGTAAGPAIFSQMPVRAAAEPRINSVATSNDIVVGQCTTISADKKTLTCIYARGNSSLVSILGVNILGLRAPDVGTAVSVTVVGM